MNDVVRMVLIFSVIGAVLWWLRRRQQHYVNANPEQSLGVVAQRIGLQVVEGDPAVNLMILDAPLGDYRRTLCMRGQPFGRPVEWQVRDGVETRHLGVARQVRSFYDSTVRARLGVAVPPFEVVLRKPDQYLQPAHSFAEDPRLREVSTGQAALDALFLLRAADPRVGPALGGALSVLAHQSFVHLAGEGGEMWITVVRMGLPNLVRAPEEYFLALETAGCGLEGRPAPAALPAAADAGGSSARAAAATAGGGGEPPAMEGMPAPCPRCGGGMVPRGVHGLHAELQVVCPYCQHAEALPHDANERHRLLRLRLLQLQRTREDAEAPLQQLRSMQGKLPTIALCLLLVAGYHVTTSWAALGPMARAGLVSVGTLLNVTLPIGMVLGVLVGWAVLVWRYRVAVQPLLRAAPPVALGLAARCRCCGGALPIDGQAHVTCSYCQAVNFFDARGGAQQGVDLQRQAEAHRRRLADWSRGGAVFERPLRFGYAAAFLVATTSTLASTALLWLVFA